MHRRDLLSAGSLLAALPFAAGASSRKDCPAVPVTRERYDEYVRLFNELDPRFLDFYTQDVEINLGSELKGRDAIMGFFAKSRQNVSETTQTEFFCSDANGAAARISGVFRCIKDFQDARSGRLVKKGEMRKQRGLVYYLIKEGKFSRIIVGTPETLADWHQESTSAG